LNKATKNLNYLKEAEAGYEKLNEQNNEFNWDEKIRGITLLLAKKTKKMRYKVVLWEYLDWLMEKNKNNNILSFSLNSNMKTANAAFLALSSVQMAQKAGFARRYVLFAKQQMTQLVGGDERSFVVGFGVNSPKSPHHRGSSCPTPPLPCKREHLYGSESNPNKLYGALVSGPNSSENYEDSTSNEVGNDVSIAANAAFQSLAVGLQKFMRNVG